MERSRDWQLDVLEQARFYRPNMGFQSSLCSLMGSLCLMCFISQNFVLPQEMIIEVEGEDAGSLDIVPQVSRTGPILPLRRFAWQ